MVAPAWDSTVSLSCEELHEMGHWHPVWLTKVKIFMIKLIQLI
jgi:hypothetical protein